MISFDEATHTYTHDGAVVPSVTQILKPLNDLSHIPAEILARKAALGTAVHKACELLLGDSLDEETLHPEVAPYVTQFKDFLLTSGFESLLIEDRVFSKRRFYAGTLDLYGGMNGKRVLIDIKTAAAMHPVYGPQTAAYAAALIERFPEFITEERYALQLLPDKWKLHPLKDPTDLNTFYAALTLHHWKHTHGEAA